MIYDNIDPEMLRLNMPEIGETDGRPPLTPCDPTRRRIEGTHVAAYAALVLYTVDFVKHPAHSVRLAVDVIPLAEQHYGVHSEEAFKLRVSADEDRALAYTMARDSFPGELSYADALELLERAKSGAYIA